MRRKKDFMAQQVAGEWVVVAVGRESLTFQKLLRLNDSALLLWNALEKERSEAELVALLRETYEVSEETAAADVRALTEQLRTLGCLE